MLTKPIKKIIIAGDYENKFEEIIALISQFEKNKIQVVSPVIIDKSALGAGANAFIASLAGAGKTIRPNSLKPMFIINQRFEKMNEVDGLYIANFEGQLADINSTSYGVDCAQRASKPIFFITNPSEPTNSYDVKIYNAFDGKKYKVSDIKKIGTSREAGL